MKKVLTAKDAEALLKQGKSASSIPEGVLLTPSAKDVLKAAAGRNRRQSRASIRVAVIDTSGAPYQSVRFQHQFTRFVKQTYGKAVKLGFSTIAELAVFLQALP